MKHLHSSQVPTRCRQGHGNLIPASPGEAREELASDVVGEKLSGFSVLQLRREGCPGSHKPRNTYSSERKGIPTEVLELYSSGEFS